MQIFLKHPGNGKTLVFSCSSQTTIFELLQYITDSTGWPSHAYYIVSKGKIISIRNASASFSDLNIQDSDSLHLCGRSTPAKN